MKQYDDTYQVISNDENKTTRVSIISFNVEERNVDDYQAVILQCQPYQDKSLQIAMVSLQKRRSSSNTVIARLPLGNSWNPLVAVAPPLLKSQKSTHLNNVSESDQAPSIQALPLPNPSRAQNIPQHQNATLEVIQIFSKAIASMTAWQMLSDNKYSKNN